MRKTLRRLTKRRLTVRLQSEKTLLRDKGLFWMLKRKLRTRRITLLEWENSRRRKRSGGLRSIGAKPKI